ALSRSLPRAVWASFPVRPDTLLRWRRQLVACRWTDPPQTKTGRPPLEPSVGALILRLGRENPHRGYRRIVGELKGLGVPVSPTTVRKVLIEAGRPPAPERAPSENVMERAGIEPATSGLQSPTSSVQPCSLRLPWARWRDR